MNCISYSFLCLLNSDSTVTCSVSPLIECIDKILPVSDLIFCAHKL
jgi:hypothetical protein